VHRGFGPILGSQWRTGKKSKNQFSTRRHLIDGASSGYRVGRTPQLTKGKGVGEGELVGDVMRRVIVLPHEVGQAVFMSVSRTS